MNARCSSLSCRRRCSISSCLWRLRRCPATKASKSSMALMATLLTSLSATANWMILDTHEQWPRKIEWATTTPIATIGWAGGKKRKKGREKRGRREGGGVPWIPPWDALTAAATAPSLTHTRCVSPPETRVFRADVPLPWGLFSTVLSVQIHSWLEGGERVMRECINTVYYWSSKRAPSLRSFFCGYTLIHIS